MTITDILNFANKYNLSDEARDELIKMIVLNQTNNNKTKFNATPYNPKIGPSDSILQESLILSSQGKVSSAPKKVVVSSHEYCHIYPGDIRFKVNDCFCKRDNVIWIGRSF